MVVVVANGMLDNVAGSGSAGSIDAIHRIRPDCGDGRFASCLTTGRYLAILFLHAGVQGMHRAVDAAEKIAAGGA